MNKQRWKDEKDTQKLALKLAEETGEVCKAIMAKNGYGALVELAHVRVIRDRLEEVLRESRRQVSTVQRRAAGKN